MKIFLRSPIFNQPKCPLFLLPIEMNRSFPPTAGIGKWFQDNAPVKLPIKIRPQTSAILKT
jgi:hypothetical protein